LGKVLLRQARLSAAFDSESNTDRLFEASVAIFRKLGARHELAHALCYEGGCESAYGNAHGGPLCEEAFSILGQLDDKRGMALALRGLAWVALHQADYPLAKLRFQESVALLNALEDQKETAHSLGGLGYICYILGEYQTASQHHREMLGLCTEMGDQRGIASSTGYFAIDAFGLRDLEQAERLWQAGLALYREIGDLAGMADGLGDMGELANLRGEYARAAQFAQEALACWRKIYGDLITWSFTWPLRVLGNAMRGLGDLPAARRYLRQSLEQASMIRRWGHSLTALVGVAALLADEGKAEYALEILYMVMSHRASWQLARDQAAPLIAQLEARLPPDVVASAQARGRSRDLEATVAELLVELGGQSE
jgi:tetratricopeptide (TPR) repeat protein